MEPNTPNKWPIIAIAAFIFILVSSTFWLNPPAPSAKAPVATKPATAVKAPVAMSKTDEITEVCNAKNPGEFNGKTLYNCVFAVMVKRDLSLMETGKRNAFINKWQHKFDGTTMLDAQDDAYLAIATMVADLGEMHTAFFRPKETKELFEHTNGNLEGIGAPLARLGMASAAKALGEKPSEAALKSLAKITQDTPLVVFPAPEKDTPADKAGILGGDRIVAVNGTTIIGLTINETVDLIKGPAGTKVTLSIKRPVSDGLEDKEIVITRGEVHFPQVKTEFLGHGFVKLQITNFTTSVAEEFTNALYKACTGKELPYDEKVLMEIVQSYKPATDCALKGLVLDVRNNPGGVLEQVLAMGQLIMAGGPTITIQQRDGDSSIEVRERIEGDNVIQEKVVDGKIVESQSKERFVQLLPEIPMVVLTNEGSASASEILAGMLQANGLATVIGNPSFGKEVGQQVLPVDFGTAIKVTTFRFLPGNKPLGAAIIPDFVVEQNDAYIDDPFHGEDAQVSKAVEILSRGKAAIVEAQGVDAQAVKAKLADEVANERAERDRKIMEFLHKGLTKFPE
jgi:C-terminal processing protease CtpA/Prc